MAEAEFCSQLLCELGGILNPEQDSTAASHVFRGEIAQHVFSEFTRLDKWVGLAKEPHSEMCMFVVFSTIIGCILYDPYCRKSSTTVGQHSLVLAFQ